MRISLFTLLMLTVSLSFGQQTENFQLHKGDLLFQDLDCGPLCDAIETVTTGYRGARLSHVGIVDKDKNNQWIVLEAISDHVHKTPLLQFLNRSDDKQGNPKVLVGRLKKQYKKLIPAALTEAHRLLGKPYDNIYVMGDSTYYCSELVYEIFKKANGENPIFHLYPMTFKDPATGDTFPAWTEYYKKLNHSIPEGEPGLNPGGISRSDKIKIVHYYGKPENFKPKN